MGMCVNLSGINNKTETINIFHCKKTNGPSFSRFTITKQLGFILQSKWWQLPFSVTLHTSTKPTESTCVWTFQLTFLVSRTMYYNKKLNFTRFNCKNKTYNPTLQNKWKECLFMCCVSWDVRNQYTFNTGSSIFRHFTRQKNMQIFINSQSMVSLS